MSHVKVITPPDKLYTNNLSFLLIYPSQIVKEEFQNIILNFDENFDVYIYDIENKEDHDVEWLLSTCYRCEYVILDIDNCPSIIRDLASYIIGNTNTYWLTFSSENLYNTLSKNRIFNLDFLTKDIGAQLEQKFSKTKETAARD